ncbi:hypothetical protein VpasPP24_20 [Vibrio phage Vpas_PP24]|uniref:hypothetical protein n=1 Tax=Vibrio phage SIO-2 TaxID=700512 RepID=UPI0002357C3D|nr:hypothetical protein VPEG_00023 [Vibrio phage SIO-2]AET42174.1 hypothetical protein VPEG_00023 [Vibrio phage SIO-2]QKE60781.1 hypothetical protein vBVhaSVHB1_94 [Vibrio phage vB_VhaS-VHB1]UOX38360.1 hypothetical protein VpasPP24_20 [Vibrio phage Vpas_PP24]
MNIAKINALLNIIAGIKQTNELLALPVEWSNGIIEARDYIQEAKECEQDQENLRYTILTLDLARNLLTIIARKIEKDTTTKPHIKALVLAQVNAILETTTEVMTAIKESR